MRARVSLLGVRCDVSSYPDAIKRVMEWVRTGKKAHMFFVNAYGLVTCRHDGKLRALVNAADFIGMDGMPLVWAGRLYSPRAERVYGTTLVRMLLRTGADRRLRHYFLGAQSGQGARLLRAIRRNFPGCVITGVYETPDRPLAKNDTDAAIRDMNRSRADIVYVGLGVPHQERWIAENRSRITAPVVMGVGSTVDFLSGDRKEAPERVQRAGFEWLFRFVQEPGRLWYRYTVVNLRFVCLIVTQLVRDAVSGKLTGLRRTKTR